MDVKMIDIEQSIDNINLKFEALKRKDRSIEEGSFFYGKTDQLLDRRKLVQYLIDEVKELEELTDKLI